MNSVVFSLGMLTVFLLVSIFQWSSLSTASVGDAFGDVNSSQDIDLLSWWRQSLDISRYDLIPSSPIESHSWTSMRIDFLYNPDMRDVIVSSLSSSYLISSTYHDDVLSVIIDTSHRDIVSGEPLLSFSLDVVDEQFIPIIQTIQLFDGERVEQLSFTTLPTSHHH